MRSSANEPLLVLSLLTDVPDPRRRPTRVVYPLTSLLFIVLVGTLAGMQGWKEIALFAESHAAWLRQFLELPERLPSAQTYMRVLAALNPEALEIFLQRWAAALASHFHGEVLAVDGKAIRGVIDPDSPSTPLYQLHVWATRMRLMLGVRTIPGAPAEGPALQDLLPLLEVRGATISGDANFCSQANTAVVRECHAHFAFALKGNRGPLHARVKQTFAALSKLRARGVAVSKYVGTHAGHGRRERRTIHAVDAKAAGVDTRGWTDVRTVVKIRRERWTDSGYESATHYAISSRPADARALAHVLRQHWRVENECHWQLDVAFDEDSIRIRNAARALAIFRRVALVLLKRDTTTKAGIAIRMKKAAMNATYLQHLLSLGNTSA